MNIEYICGTSNIFYACPNGCQTESQISYDTHTCPTTIRTSRYYSQKQCMCENATDSGYCKFTVCIYK